MNLIECTGKIKKLLLTNTYISNKQFIENKYYLKIFGPLIYMALKALFVTIEILFVLYYILIGTLLYIL